MSRGQVSFEYLFILGFAFILIAGAVIVFTAYSRSTGVEVSGGQIDRVGREIQTTAEKVYGLGQDSWATIELTLPAEIVNITILNNEELVIEYNTQEGISEAVYFFDFPIITDGDSVIESIGRGRTLLRIRSTGTTVYITDLGDS